MTLLPLSSLNMFFSSTIFLLTPAHPLLDGAGKLNGVTRERNCEISLELLMSIEERVTWVAENGLHSVRIRDGDLMGHFRSLTTNYRQSWDDEDQMLFLFDQVMSLVAEKLEVHGFEKYKNGTDSTEMKSKPVCDSDSCIEGTNDANLMEMESMPVYDIDSCMATITSWPPTNVQRVFSLSTFERRMLQVLNWLVLYGPYLGLLLVLNYIWPGTIKMMAAVASVIFIISTIFNLDIHI
eukprot:GEMP01091551.1.p1 GENE.GEMP01091551.1~~GEMP01091551.1.p1  ORF type:complete len:238 (+),score=19.76 GEMP01091551.1:2-715(+)